MVVMKLFVKLLRDMKQSVGQVTAIVLIVAVGAFFYAGLTTYSHDLSAYTKVYMNEHHLSDLNVDYTRISPSDVVRLSEIAGFSKAQGRYTFEARQAFQDYKASLIVHSLPAKDQINMPTMIDGHIPTTKNEILLDSQYANEHHFQVGDTIRLTVNDRPLVYTISGLCEDVEHAKLNETQNHKTAGAAYVAEATIPRILNGGFYYNEVMIDAKAGYNIDKLGQAIEEQSRKDHLPYVGQVSKERTFSYSQLQETIYNDDLMSKVIPFVFFLIESIILFLAMSRIVDSQRGQIGIMKALGVKDRIIMLHYLIYPVLVGIVGSILGFVSASIVFIPLVTASNARAYSLPGITFSLSYDSLFVPIIFASAFGIVSCYLSGRAILKERAALAMRPKPPKKMKRLWVERIPGIWKHIPCRYRLIVRNILLNKKRAAVSSIGVIASTVLLITAFGTEASLLKVANQVEKVYGYDLRVDYATGTSLNQMKLPPGVKSSYPLSILPVELMTRNVKENATLVVTEQGNNLIHFFDQNGQRISLANHGVLVPKSFADKYHISKGETIQLKFIVPELKHKTVNMKVSAVSTQYLNPAFYCTPDYLQSFGVANNPTSLVMKVKNPTDLTSIRNSLEQDQHVDTITDRSDVKQLAQYILKQNSFVFIMFIICAAILSFGAIYTISSINIYERNRELATLKVLGYQKKKINRLIFLENIILTTFAVIVAIPISGYVYILIIKALSSSHQQIPEKLSDFMILVSVILAFMFTVASNLILRRNVTNIKMIESLKSVE